jgi:hypothetical protein
MGAPRSRACPTACAPVAAHPCTQHHDEEHEAAPGPSAAHGCTKDDYLDPTAAPGPSRTCASMEAMGLGACNLRWPKETEAPAEAAAADSMGLRPSPWHETRLSPTSLSSFVAAAGAGAGAGAAAAAAAAASRQPPAASRQPPAASRQPPAARRQPPAASRPPPAASRVRVPSDRFQEATQATCAQPSGLTRCTSARGTRRCHWLRVVVLCARLCSAGTRRCPVLPRCRQVHTIVQRRARTQSDAHVDTRPPWSVWPGKSSRMVTKPG